MERMRVLGQPNRQASWILTSPVFVGSIVLLFLNDHVLKAAWPGLVTGKLSDVAGVAMMALLATALLRRPAVAFVGVGVAFALLKTVPAVADLAVPVLGGRTLTDPTDTLALLVLAPLWRWVRRRGESSVAPPDRPGVAATWARVGAVGAAVLVTSATSCLSVGVDRVYLTGDGVVAETSSGAHLSVDGGRTWGPYVKQAGESGEFAPSVRSVCIGDDCFELVDLGVVQVDVSGNQVPEFVVTQQQLDNLAANFTDSCTSRFDLFSTIAVVDGPDGPNLVVSMSEYGVLHRSADGDWTWRDVGKWSYDGDQLDVVPEKRLGGATFIRVSLGAAGLMAIAGVVAGAVSLRRRHTGWMVALQIIAGVSGALAVLGALLMAVFAVNFSAASGGSYWLFAVVAVPVVAFLAVCALVQLLATPRQSTHDTRNGLGVPPDEIQTGP